MTNKCTFSDIENIFEKIEESLKSYKNSRIQDKSFTLILANGEEIKYEIPYETIPHILGIKTEFFSSTNFFGTKKSDEILEKMLETPYKVYTKIANNPEKVISKYISKKIDNFNELLYLNLDNIMFVCTYDAQRTYGFKEQSECVDYIIISQRQDGQYSVLNLVKNDNGICYIRSNRLYEDYEKLEKDLEEYLPNQNITLATGCKVYDKKNWTTSKPYWLYVPKKEEKSKIVYKYAKRFGATVDVFSDYYKAISCIHDDFKGHKVDSEIIELIINIAQNRQIITDDFLVSYGNLDEQISRLIATINDLIFSTSNGVENGTVMKYSDLDAKIKHLERENDRLTEENNKLKSENKTLSERYIDSESAKAELIEKLNKIKSIL